MVEQAQQILDETGYSDWTVDSESTLISPNGHSVEWDGTSEDGEVSPLISLGMI